MRDSHARLMPTAAHPVIYAEWLGAPGKPTVLIYGHYDVQPPEPLAEWLSPPFEPTVRDGKLFARGAGDNKGQIFAQIAAARAWLETAGELPVNVKFLIEGEEETGSPHLEPSSREHRELLAADLVYTSDGPVQDDAHPQVVYGVRGLPLRRVAGAGRQPRSPLRQLGRDGAEPGLDAGAPARHDARRRRRGHDRRLLRRRATGHARGRSGRWRRCRWTSGAALATVGIDRLPPPDGLGYFERLMATPTLNIAGLHQRLRRSRHQDGASPRRRW